MWTMTVCFTEPRRIYLRGGGAENPQEQKRILLDIGYGANAQLGRFGLRGKINAILITHDHGDHIGDLAALGQDLQYPKDADGAALKSSIDPNDPSTRIPVYGPARLKEELERNTKGKGFPRPIPDAFDFHTINPGEPITIGGLTVTAFPVDHLRNKEALGEEALEESYAFRVEGDGQSFAYSGDTGELESGVPSPGLLAAAQDADLALIEAFYLKKAEEFPGLHLSGHTAGEAAQKAGVRKLLLTHHHPNVSPLRILAEAHQTYEGRLQSARQGTTYPVQGDEIRATKTTAAQFQPLSANRRGIDSQAASRASVEPPRRQISRS